MLVNRLKYVAKHLGKMKKGGNLGLDIYEPGRGKLYALVLKEEGSTVATRLSEYMPIREFWRYLSGLNEAAEWVRSYQDAEVLKFKKFIDYALEQWGLIDDGETLTRVRRRYQLMLAGADISFRCPRDPFPNMNLESCAARKERKHHGCVTCKVPGQKRREIRAKQKEGR
jgi:hypothetical protein